MLRTSTWWIRKVLKITKILHVHHLNLYGKTFRIRSVIGLKGPSVTWQLAKKNGMIMFAPFYFRLPKQSLRIQSDRTEGTFITFMELFWWFWWRRHQYTLHKSITKIPNNVVASLKQACIFTHTFSKSNSHCLAWFYMTIHFVITNWRPITLGVNLDWNAVPFDPIWYDSNHT